MVNYAFIKAVSGSYPDGLEEAGFKLYSIDTSGRFFVLGYENADELKLWKAVGKERRVGLYKKLDSQSLLQAVMHVDRAIHKAQLKAEKFVEEMI